VGVGPAVVQRDARAAGHRPRTLVTTPVAARLRSVPWSSTARTRPDPGGQAARADRNEDGGKRKRADRSQGHEADTARDVDSILLRASQHGQDLLPLRAWRLFAAPLY
jgi:hypothetical protein